MKKASAFIAVAFTLSACEHTVTHNVNRGFASTSTPTTRLTVADETCESQANIKKQSYLAAIEDVIARRASAASASTAAVNAPLDRFRSEVNAAHRAVVMRCKTHMNCLEANYYDEAKCYMSASDRKDAERRFADLSYRLRDIEREVRLAVISKTQSKQNLTINNSLQQTAKQKQGQTQSADNTIVDQDILQLCGSSEGLLDRRCIRSQCSNGGRCRR